MGEIAAEVLIGRLADGSVLPTQGAANPALTIMALAARCADRLISGSRSGLKMASR